MDACILNTCNCKKGYWHPKLDEASSYLTTFNMEMGWYRFTVMPFGITVAGDMFQCKLDECFDPIKNLIVIADDIMVIGRNQNHKDHDLAFTTLLYNLQETAISSSIIKKTPIQMHTSKFLWGNLHNRWLQTRPE